MNRRMTPLTDLPTPIPVPLRGWRLPPHLPPRPKATLPRERPGKRRVCFVDSPVGLPYTADDASGSVRDSTTSTAPKNGLNRTFCSTASAASSSQLEHALPVLSPPRHRRPLTRYDDLSSSPVRIASRRRKRHASPSSPLSCRGTGTAPDPARRKYVVDATVIAVAAAAQRTAREESPIKVMWERYTRGRDHWSPPSARKSPSVPSTRTARDTRVDDHWSPSPPRLSSSRSRSSRRDVKSSTAPLGDHWSPPAPRESGEARREEPETFACHGKPRPPSSSPPPLPPLQDEASEDREDRLPCRRRRVHYAPDRGGESRSSRR